MSEELLPCPFCGGPASKLDGHYDFGGEWFETGCDNVGCPVLPSIKALSREHANESWNTRADLARAQVAAVKVKPLVWEDFDGGHGVKANAMLLVSYLIVKRRDGIFEVTVSCPGYQTWFDGKPRHDTLEAAKAAAQADYERRILSALDAPVDANALVAAAYEAAAKKVSIHMLGRNKAFADRVVAHIRAIIPDYAKAALDAMLKAERAKAHKDGQMAAFKQVVGHLTYNKPSLEGNHRAQGYHAGWMDALAAVREMAREAGE